MPQMLQLVPRLEDEFPASRVITPPGSSTGLREMPPLETVVRIPADHFWNHKGHLFLSSFTTPFVCSLLRCRILVTTEPDNETPESRNKNRRQTNFMQTESFV